MKRELIFPTIMNVLSLAASAVFFAKGDVRKGLYFFFGACITSVVTY